MIPFANSLDFGDDEPRGKACLEIVKTLHSLKIAPHPYVIGLLPLAAMQPAACVLKMLKEQ